MLTHFMLNLGPRGCGFETHRRHCIVSLSNTYLSLLRRGSTQEEPFDITERLLTGTYRIKSNQTKTHLVGFVMLLLIWVKSG